MKLRLRAVKINFAIYVCGTFYIPKGIFHSNAISLADRRISLQKTFAFAKVFCLELLPGFEPGTSTLPRWCSTD